MPPADEFAKRLTDAMKRTQTAAPSGPAGQAAASAVKSAAKAGALPPDSDAFADRLKSAMAQARGESAPAAPAGAPAAPASAAGTSAAVLTAGTGPVGTGERLVTEGDCIESISMDTGHFWQTLWDDPGNSELKQVRSPNTLLQGDRVHVPDLRRKDESGATAMRHRFRRKGMPSLFRLQLRQDNKPRAYLAYTLVIDGTIVSGETDADGKLEQPIPPDAQHGKLILSEQEQYEFQLGALDPVTEMSGVLTRLVNLHYLDAKDKKNQKKVRAAIEDFQRDNNLSATGDADQATKQKLLEVHGC